MSLYIPVGQIVSAHGIKGEVKFRYYNEVYEQFLKYTSLYYDSEGKKSELKINEVRRRGSIFILRFEKIYDRDTAEKLKGKILYAKEEDLPELEEGEYYFFQLVGLEVKNEKGENLGRVKEIITTGPNQILVIEGEKEILIPMVEDFVISVNLKERTLTVKEPEYI